MFKEVNDFVEDIDIKKGEVNKEYIGEYCNKKTITTKFGENYIYTFNNVDTGEKFAIFGFSNLNYKMSNVEIGSLCKISYNGKKEVKTKFGTSEAHQASVMIDTDYKKAEKIINKTFDNEDVPFDENDTKEDPLSNLD